MLFIDQFIFIQVFLYLTKILVICEQSLFNWLKLRKYRQYRNRIECILKENHSIIVSCWHFAVFWWYFWVFWHHFNRKSVYYSGDSKKCLYYSGNSRKYIYYIGVSWPTVGGGGAVPIITQRFHIPSKYQNNRRTPFIPRPSHPIRN